MRVSHAVALSSIVLVLVFIFPLMVFSVELNSDPRVFVVSYMFYSGRSGWNCLVNITYRGSVPLYDTVVSVNGRDVYVGDVRPGSSVARVVSGVPFSDPPSVTVSFRVAGIYRVSVGKNVEPVAPEG